jgi:GH25 family lysozyme M1 (1,4-beta-N-acetylmuramidase)
MNGIDVSAWQPANITGIVDFDFVIIKATQGTSYISPSWRSQADIARTREKKIGLYHFADGIDPVAEADFFLSVVKDYIGAAILILDFEGGAVARGAAYVHAFVQRIKEKAQVPPFVYGSASPLAANNIPQAAAEENCALWVAAYPSTNSTGYRDEPQLLGSVIRQYASTGRLAGYSGNLDMDISTLTPDQWDKYAKGQRTSDTVVGVVTKLTNDEIATQVIAGSWGNGEDRKSRLTAAGYSPSDIQALVNMKLGQVAAPTVKPDDQVATEVIGGLWGNGQDRIDRLKEAGYNPDTIQSLVNGKLGVNAASKAVYFTVPSGASGYLGNISSRFGTSVDDIVSMNKAKYPSITPNYVQAGWVIQVQ